MLTRSLLKRCTPMSTSMGIYKYDNFDYLQFVLNERGLFFYNESGDITKSYPAY